MIRDKKFYKLLLALALPIALQDLIKFGLNLADNLMIGQLGETAISAVSLANQPFFLFSMMVFGLGSGGSVLLAQYYGKGDSLSIRRVTSVTITIALSFSVLITVLVLLLPREIMSLFSEEADVILGGVEYLRIVGFTFFFYGITNTLVLLLRGVQSIRPTVIINAIAFFINIALNWVLIGGHLGMPRLEIRGAAYATLTARVVESALMVWYVFRKDKVLKLSLRGFFPLHRGIVRNYFKYVCPVALNEFAWGLATVLVTLVLGRMGKEAVSAGSITSSVREVLSVLLFALAGAAGILIGNAVGAGKKEYAHQAARTLLVLQTGLGILMGLLLWAVIDPVLSLYALQPATRATTRTLLTITCGIVPVDALCILSIVGILRGGGDTRFAALADQLPMWLLSVPLGALGGLRWGWTIPLTYVALRMDTVVKMVACLIRALGKRWVHDVTREGSKKTRA